MRTWKITKIGYNGMEVIIVTGHNIYDALMATNNLNDPDIIAIELVPNGTMLP